MNLTVVRQFLLIVILCVGVVPPVMASQSGFCGIVLGPTTSHYLRILATFAWIQPAWLLKGTKLISIDKMTDSDHLLWQKHLEVGREVKMYEALDKDGNVIARSTMTVGTRFSTPILESLQDLLRQLDAIYPSVDRHQVHTIRSVHTHPSLPMRSIINHADIDVMLGVLAVFERMGFHVAYEESIVFQRYNGTLLKNTIQVPKDGLSFIRNDYSLGIFGDNKLLHLFFNPPTHNRFILKDQ
jgi:hypothetical protein